MTYEGIINHAEAKATLMKLNYESRICLSFNIGFVASIWQLLTPIILGAELYIYDNDLYKKPYQFLEQLDIDKVNIVSMIPQALYSYCHYIGEKHIKLSLTNIKYIILTGEGFDKAVPEQFYKNYSHITLINAYGQSECSDDTFHYEIPKTIKTLRVPIGNPIKNVSYYILNEHFIEVKNDEKGELYIGGACLAKNYLNDDLLTTKKFVNISNCTYFRTGDIVTTNENQEVIWLGRADNQVKIRGYRIEPEEIESYLNEIECINQSLVIVSGSNEIDKELIAYYTSEKNITTNDIVKHLSSKLPPYMIPSVFKRVENFILNANGKVDRNKIIECNEMKVDKNIEKNQTLYELTTESRKIFEVILANIDKMIRDKVTLDTDFNTIGINSITFIELVVLLESKFDIEFDVDMLLITKYSTIRSMVEYVKSRIEFG